MALRCSGGSEAAFDMIASPAAPGASAPFLASTPRGVLASWIEPVAGSERFAVRVASYENGRWTTPSTVVDRNDLFVNWADFPSVAEDGNGAWFAHWLQKSGPGTYAYDVRMAVSKDRGKSWSEPFLVNRDGTRTEHGFASVVPLQSGVAVTWLDGRNMNAEAGHEHDAGEMTIRYAAVHSDGTISSEAELDGRVCECCTTAMTIASAGPVIAYRDRSPEEVRDISYVRRAGADWMDPKRVSADEWKINACPVNGPQLDSAGEHVVISWFTAAGERQRVYAAFSDDSGATFGAPMVIDDGKPAGRIDVVMLNDQAALVCWLEQTASGAEIRARRITREGNLADSIRIADSSTARAAGFPRMARSGDAIWFAWTQQSPGRKDVRIARLRLPGA